MMMLMFQIFVALVSTATAIEFAVLLKRLCERGNRTAHHRQNSPPESEEQSDVSHAG